MRQPARVVLADDHHAFVEGLGMVLSAEDDLEVVALAGDGASALRAVRTHRPDVLVVDTQMPARRSPSWSAWSARPGPPPGCCCWPRTPASSPRAVPTRPATPA